MPKLKNTPTVIAILSVLALFFASVIQFFDIYNFENTGIPYIKPFLEYFLAIIIAASIVSKFYSSYKAVDEKHKLRAELLEDLPKIIKHHNFKLDSFINDGVSILEMKNILASRTYAFSPERLVEINEIIETRVEMREAKSN